MKTNLLEEDIIKSYRGLVQDECRYSYKGLEWEDRLSEANLVLLHCIRTYKLKYGDFENYFTFQLRRNMRLANKKAWAAKRIESRISLDAPLKDGNCTLHDCIGKESVNDFIMNLKSFISVLTSKERVVVAMRFSGYRLKSIAGILKITQSAVHAVLNSIKLKYKFFFG